MSHDVADVRWHSLQGLKSYFIEAMAEMDFHGDYEKAHMAADTGAEFTLQHSSTLNYINATWQVPVDDIVRIYERLYKNGQRQQTKVPSSDHLIYCITSAFAASKMDLEFGRFLFGYYGSKSPFLIEELVDYYKGGLQDMSASVAECHADMINALEEEKRSPDRLLCGSYFDDGNKYNQHKESRPTNNRINRQQENIQKIIGDVVEQTFDDEHGVLTLSFLPNKYLSAIGNSITTTGADDTQLPTLEYFQPPKKSLLQLPIIINDFWKPKKRPTCTDLRQVDDDWVEEERKNRHTRPPTAVTLSLPESSVGIGYATAMGDLDADGERELIISAPYHGPSTQQIMSGAVFVLNGTHTLLNSKKPSGTSTAVIDDIRDASRVVLMGTEKRARFGWSMATVDLNGDGIDDLAVAAPFANENQGYISIFYGRKNTGITSKPDLHIQLPHTEGFGLVMSGLDINGDGYKDVVVGCPFCTVAGRLQAGSVHIFLSSKHSVTVPSHINQADMTIYSTLPTPFEHFGNALEFSPSTANKLLLVGAPGYNINNNDGIRAGRVYAFAMKPWLSLAWTMEGTIKFQHFGSVILLNKSQQLLAISSPSEETKKGLLRRWQAGTVRTYDWVKLQKVTTKTIDLKQHLVGQMEGQQSAGHLGSSLAFFDNGLWVGEPMANGERGRVHRWSFNDDSVSCIKNANTMGRFGSHIQTIENDILGITSQYYSQGARFAGAVHLVQQNV
ncbi:hypothetical protein BDA99DRAFT_525975 [Phascolomyces articulosus]|uniref:Uncharacterized protein n=1 Tax=Phascolomyces articulosus TaxID=60185 RepID=A0AAD5P8I2_9FUNG|nr:hypothetical protein BDA99DRAFT_525975 [Phascolomyces articulosus]